MADVEQYKEEIRRTFALVKPIATQAAAIFYATLWEIDPETKPLFKNTDMEKQGQKLMKVLGICVTTLRNMDALVPLLEKLGRKHVSYGVKPNMYPSVARALLITMEKALGEECKPMTKDAWQWILELISKICIDAANEFEAEQAKPQVEPTPVEEQPANA